jgi:hypothetical protein
VSQRCPQDDWSNKVFFVIYIIFVFFLFILSSVSRYFRPLPVYDGIYPIVGYEKLFILGITVSMAWQLPSEPFYKTLETVLEKQKNLVKIDKPSLPSPTPDPLPDPMPSIDDDSTKLQYIDSNEKYNFYHSSDNGYGGNKYYIDRTSDPDSKKYYTSDGYDKLYYKKTPTNIKYGYYGPQNWSKNDWVNIIQRWVMKISHDFLIIRTFFRNLQCEVLV